MNHAVNIDIYRMGIRSYCEIFSAAEYISVNEVTHNHMKYYRLVPNQIKSQPIYIFWDVMYIFPTVQELVL